MARVSCQFAFAALFLFPGCADNPPTGQIATEEQVDILPEPDSAQLEQVFRYWQRALDEGRYSDASRWSSPATLAWIELLEELEPASTTSTDPHITIIDGVKCNMQGDKAVCLFAELKEDRLQLDSIQLLRLDNRWVVHLVENNALKGEQ